MDDEEMEIAPEDDGTGECFLHMSLFISQNKTVDLHEVLIQITTICPLGEIMDDEAMENVAEDDGTGECCLYLSC